MKEEIRDVFGVPMGEENRSFKVPMLVYETVDEGDKAAGKAGAVLEQCNNNLLYRGTYAEARELICAAVEEVTGEKVQMKDSGEKDDKGVAIMIPAERDAVYVNRVLGGNQALMDKVQAVIEKRARGYSYTDPESKQVIQVPALAADIKQRERKATGPKKLPEKYATMAKNFITGAINPKTNKPYSLDKFLQAVKKDLQTDWTKTGNQDADVQSLGWVCKRFAEFQAEQSSLKF